MGPKRGLYILADTYKYAMKQALHCTLVLYLRPFPQQLINTAIVLQDTPSQKKQLHKISTRVNSLIMIKPFALECNCDRSWE